MFKDFGEQACRDVFVLVVVADGHSERIELGEGKWIRAFPASARMTARMTVAGALGLVTAERSLMSTGVVFPSVLRKLTGTIALKWGKCYDDLEGKLTMVTVQLSKREELVLPESLGRALGLHAGDRVEVRRQDSVLWLQRKEPLQTVGPLTDLARIVSSARPAGSVDIQETLDKHGYEQIDGRIGL
jgi:bifunctional DNA-binding transcriptional regulator/antitoxin component of YhaV-PrlF toxin-antitoxin module